MILLFSLVCLLIVGSASVKSGGNIPASITCAGSIRRFPAHVILDAGHGGEDGGAVAYDNTVEKDLNLQYAAAIAAYFDLFGVPYSMTRNDDVSLGDHSLPTVRARKASDIYARYDMINQTDRGVLLSIHQNQFRDARYSGTQVFYSPRDTVSGQIADSVQNAVRTLLQPENDRCTKPSGDSIFLLYRAKKPSVLVECGFLSNAEELSRLKDPAYRSALSYCITVGFIHAFTDQNP